MRVENGQIVEKWEKYFDTMYVFFSVSITLLKHIQSKNKLFSITVKCVPEGD